MVIFHSYVSLPEGSYINSWLQGRFFSPCSAFTVGGRHLEVQPQRAPRLRDSPVDDFSWG